jgi:hypothetical protein
VCTPQNITKALKPVLATPHTKGHISAAHQDDCFMKDQIYEKCVDNVVDHVMMLTNLGFVPHPSMCSLLPSQEIITLGFVINSVEMTIRLTPQKVTDIKTCCKLLLCTTKPTIRETA